MDLFLLEGEKVLLKMIVNSIKLKQKKIMAFQDEFVRYIFLYENAFLYRNLDSICNNHFSQNVLEIMA